MTCPTCPPDGQCSACLSEGVARGHGRPAKASRKVRVTLWVHPGFPAYLRAFAERDPKNPLSQGEAVEQACGFKP